MSDRWFEDMPEHDPNDPEEVERALRRQERAARRHQESAPKKGRGPVLGEGQSGGSGRSGGGRRSRADSGRSGRGSGSGPRTGRIVAAAAGVAGLLIGVIFVFALFQPFKGEGSGEPFPVKVPAGDSVGQIGDLLAEKGVISNATLFEIRATISGKRGDLNHGVHQFREDMSYSAAIEELTRTTSKRTITVTIPEGLSRSETADVVEAAGIPGDYMAASEQYPGFDPDEYGAQGESREPRGVPLPGDLRAEAERRREGTDRPAAERLHRQHRRGQHEVREVEEPDGL